jgi:GAF domain-containing protein
MNDCRDLFPLFLGIGLRSEVRVTVQRRLAGTFVQLADTLAEDFEITRFLGMLAEYCVEMLHVDTAGALLPEGDCELNLLASAGADGRLSGVFPFPDTEGPCCECFRDSRRVLNIDHEIATRRWPEFAKRLDSAGLARLHVLPMRRHDEVIGVLALANRAEGTLSAHDAELAEAMVATATIGILQQRALHRREELANQLQHALSSRVLIEQAKGVLAERRGIGTDAAFKVLRGYARRNRRRLTDVAAEVMRGERPDGLD